MGPNELSILGQHVLREILGEIRGSLRYSPIGDEAADISKKRVAVCHD